MPVRDKAVAKIVSMLVGPEPRDPAKADVLRFSVDAAYEEVVESIDWNRVLLDATARHLSLHKPDEGDKGGTLVAPSDEALAAAEDRDDDEDFAPPPAWHQYRYDAVCPECIAEAVLANEWGGKTGDKWQEHPRSPRWRWPRYRPRPHNIQQIVLALVGMAWIRPEDALPDELDDDGHMPLCREVGRPREARLFCDPRCPHYDGRLEPIADQLWVDGPIPFEGP